MQFQLDFHNGDVGAHGNHNERIDYGVRNGRDIAFDEGTAQFLSVVARSLAGVESSLIFDSTNLEGPGRAAGENGEDTEFSVRRTLWDLYDSANEAAGTIGYGERANSPYSHDRLSVGLNQLWEFLSTSKRTLGDVWNHFTAGRSTRRHLLMGEIFQSTRVSPGPVDFVPGLTGASSAFYFAVPTYEQNGTKRPTLDEFSLKIVGEDLDSVLLEHDFTFNDTQILGPPPSNPSDWILKYSVPADVQTQLNSIIENHNAYWAVTGAVDAPFSTGARFWSGPLRLEQRSVFLTTSELEIVNERDRHIVEASVVEMANQPTCPMVLGFRMYFEKERRPRAWTMIRPKMTALCGLIR